MQPTDEYLKKRLFRDVTTQERIHYTKGSTIKVRASSYIVITNHEDEILLTKCTLTKLWELPGGAVELGEDRLHAGIRETYEEIGINVEVEDENNFDVLDDYAYFPINGNFYHSYGFVYYAKPIDKYQKLTFEIEEIEDAKWFSKEELKQEENKSVFSRKILEKFVNN